MLSNCSWGKRGFANRNPKGKTAVVASAVRKSDPLMGKNGLPRRCAANNPPKARSQSRDCVTAVSRGKAGDPVQALAIRGTAKTAR